MRRDGSQGEEASLGCRCRMYDKASWRPGDSDEMKEQDKLLVKVAEDNNVTADCIRTLTYAAPSLKKHKKASDY